MIVVASSNVILNQISNYLANWAPIIIIIIIIPGTFQTTTNICL